MEGGYGRTLQKRKAREKLKGNGKGEGTVKGNRALVFGDRRFCQWGGPGHSPGRKKTNFVYFRLRKALLVDR